MKDRVFAIVFACESFIPRAMSIAVSRGGKQSRESSRREYSGYLDRSFSGSYDRFEKQDRSRTGLTPGRDHDR